MVGTFNVHNSLGDASIGGEGAASWESRMDNAEARHCLRRLVCEAMALADFFAKDNPRGKVTLCAGDTLAVEAPDTERACKGPRFRFSVGLYRFHIALRYRSSQR